jgi:beta-lactamase class A
MMLGSRDSRSGRSAWLFLVAVGAAVVLLAGGCGSPAASAPGGPAVAAAPAKAVVLPVTTAGVQLGWLMAAMPRLPLSSAQVRAHFDAAFLAQVSPAVLNQALQAVASLRLLSIRVSELSTVVADVAIGGAGAPAQVFLAVDRQGLINWLRISPALAPSPATWADVDAALRPAAPQVRLLVADVTGGSCQPVHGLDPGTPAPLAAAFKLYVLDALGQAVAAGTVGWNQPLTVTAPLKSLPPGELQDEPDGTRLSVLDTAAAMTSLSDNTATDMLIHLLGRPAVQAALTTTGMADPALDRPFLTTREIFTLKLRHWPALAERYLAADEAGRRALLASTVDRAPLPAVAAAAAWIAPRAVTSLEYFASASDLCRVYASLAALARRPGLAPIGQVPSLNDDGLQLDPVQWKATWFKGGSEPGVLTLAFMATTRTGHSYVVTVLAEDPSAPINQATAIPAILSAVKAAFTLAARAGQDAIYTAAHGSRPARQPPELNPASALTRRPGTGTSSWRVGGLHGRRPGSTRLSAAGRCAEVPGPGRIRAVATIGGHKGIKGNLW